MRVIPSLDQLARDPSVAVGLPPAVLVALHLQCATALSAIGLAWAASGQSGQQATAENREDRMLTPDEAASILRRSKRWIYRHADHLPFIKRLSPKSVLCSEAGIKKWLERQRA
jgi:predicted DNA-binding transcriptional regulator AlpA